MIWNELDLRRGRVWDGGNLVKMGKQVIIQEGNVAGCGETASCSLVMPTLHRIKTEPLGVLHIKSAGTVSSGLSGNVGIYSGVYPFSASFHRCAASVFLISNICSGDCPSLATALISYRLAVITALIRVSTCAADNAKPPLPQIPRTAMRFRSTNGCNPR